MRRRSLVWTKNGAFAGWACSECAWLFNPPAALVGKSLDEMQNTFELQRKREFAAHLCEKHPKAANLKTKQG
jgi:hypothetical protein